MANRTIRGVRPKDCDRSIWSHVGRRLRARRVQLGLSVRRVADELGIEPSVYRSYEAGAEQTHALLQLIEVAELFDVPVSWFFRDAEEGDRGAAKAAGNRRSSYVYRVATMEQRIDHLADSFGSLDFERQQCLLAIAAALSRSDRG